MNCKKGDLAIVIKSSHGGNLGKIVECVNFYPHVLYADFSVRDAWETNPPLLGVNGIETLVPDSFLRPIRDQDGEDETFTWAGKPEKVTV